MLRYVQLPTRKYRFAMRKVEIAVRIDDLLACEITSDVSKNGGEAESSALISLVLFT